MKLIKDIGNFVRLSRPLNVWITFIAFALGSYLAFEKRLIFLEIPDFWIAACCLVIISGTGYWINDVFDLRIDRINKPKQVIVSTYLSTKKVITAYWASLLAVMIFSVAFQPLRLIVLNLSAIGLLFVYAWLFKRISVAGNLLIATLTMLVLVYASMVFQLVRWPLIWTAIFAFEVTFIREVVKDIEDIKGDLKYKLRTLPIQSGVRTTKRILVGAFTVFILSCYAPVVQSIWMEEGLNWGYLLASVIVVQAPAAWLMFRLGKAVHRKDFTRLSRWLKWLIFLGIVSVLFL